MRATIQMMFQGQGEEALNLYTDVFPEATTEEVKRVGADGPGAPGSLESALLRLGDRTFWIYDSPIAHDFTFTPSISISVELDDPAEVDRAFERLASGGTVLMPVGAYPFNPHFGWLTDRFAVSWQLGVVVG